MFKVKLFLLTTSALMAMYSSLPIEQNRSYDYPQANPDENRGRNKHFLEGDILISKDEARQMFERRKAKQSERRSGRSARSVDGQHQVERRSAHYKYYKTWYNRTIPYDFDNKIHDRPEDRLRIQNAMTIIESVSCVRFVRRVDQNDYIIFRSGEDSCHSKVGRLGGAQEVNLGPDCLHSQGVVLHEILHAMGFWHEQSRMDRDDYVEVLWNNIEKDHWPNFDARDPPEDLDRIFLELPYDYGSIMHYSNTTFLNEHALRDNDVCLKPKKELQKGVVMGQRDGLSQTDIAKIKALYRCDIRNCSQPPQPENGTMDVISTSVSATVHYTCDPGFMLVGARDRVCRSNGHWSGETPVCLATDKTPLFHYCDFERPSHNLCGWIQANDDDLNWTFQKGHTTTEETGPYWDHTLGTVYGTYLYVEASSRMVVKGRKARLISPVFDLGKAKPCLIVYTSMYGQTMGNLTVYFTDRSTAIPIDTNLFTIIGDQGQYWKQIFLELDQANGPFMITLEASAGNGILSDIAIDDLIVGECDLLAPLAKSNPVRETFECSFDSGLCDFVQKTDDDFNWSRRSGSTLTVSTGPECDPLNCSGGQYLYIETSYPRTEGDRARIETPFIGGSGKHCLSFFSHMYGSTIGCLKVKQYSRDTNLETVLWEASGNQGNSWYQQRVTYESPSVYKIIFDATLGKADGPVTFTGDIAIDNVTIQIGACSGYSLFNCDFERDVCGWRNVSVPGQNFELSWVRHSGGTDTPNTGPTRDRTEYDGYYLYVESSRTLSGDLARLVSPNLERSSTGVCVKFWYHMYGQLSGTLTMYVQHGNSSRHEVWRTQGDKGEDWNSQNVNISSIHTDQDFTILFEAALQGSTGDVAIDDLSIQHSLCGS